MKHFTLLFVAALLTVASAMAGVPVKKSLVKDPAKITNAAVLKHDAAKSLDIRHRDFDPNKFKAITPRLSRDGEDNSIYEVEGTHQNYMVNSVGFTLFFGYVFFEPSQSMKEIVWGEDGDVYIKNLINAGFDTYVKGKYTDGKISIDLPQQVFYYAEEYDGEIYEESYYLTVVSINEDLEFLNDEPTTIELDVYDDANTFILDMDPEYYYDPNLEAFPSKFVGLVLDTTPGEDAWVGLGDYYQMYTIFEEEPITPPADAEVQNWVCTSYNDDGYTETRMIDVVVTDNELYIGNFHEDFYDMWVKGTIDGDKVTFETAQYMGYSDLYSLPLFFMTSELTLEYNEEIEEDEWVNVFTDNLVFKYDAEAKCLTADENCGFIINGNTESLYYLAMYIEPTIKYQDPALCNANPMDPSVSYYQPWDPDLYGGQGEIIWDIPAINVDGALLDTERMYYHLLVDGEIYALDPEEYPFVEEYMEDIPYNYTDGYDIQAMGEMHDIWFYFDGAETIGLQSFFIGYDDVVYASNVVEFNCETGETSDIKDITLTPITETQYYDMMGRRIENPSNGLYIKSMKLSDGRIRTVKVMMK